MDVPWLTLAIVAPLVGLPVLLLWRSISDDAARWVGLGASLVAFAVSMGMLAASTRASPGSRWSRSTRGWSRWGSRGSSASTGSRSGS